MGRILENRNPIMPKRIQPRRRAQRHEFLLRGLPATPVITRVEAGGFSRKEARRNALVKAALLYPGFTWEAAP